MTLDDFPACSLSALYVAGLVSASFLTGLVIGWVRRGQWRAKP